MPSYLINSDSIPDFRAACKNAWDYRKATKGEITCLECRHSRLRPSARLECSIHSSYAVAKKNTCQSAIRRDKKQN